MNQENRYEGPIPDHVKAVLDAADKKISEGAEIHFKWTCLKCGSRQTFEPINAFFIEGVCEECKHASNLFDPAVNLNYAAVYKCPTPEDFDKAMKSVLGKS